MVIPRAQGHAVFRMPHVQKQQRPPHTLVIWHSVKAFSRFLHILLLHPRLFRTKFILSLVQHPLAPTIFTHVHLQHLHRKSLVSFLPLEDVINGELRGQKLRFFDRGLVDDDWLDDVFVFKVLVGWFAFVDGEDGVDLPCAVREDLLAIAEKDAYLTFDVLGLQSLDVSDAGVKRERKGSPGESAAYSLFGVDLALELLVESGYAQRKAGDECVVWLGSGICPGDVLVKEVCKEEE